MAKYDTEICTNSNESERLQTNSNVTEFEPSLIEIEPNLIEFEPNLAQFYGIRTELKRI